MKTHNGRQPEIFRIALFYACKKVIKEKANKDRFDFVCLWWSVFTQSRISSESIMLIEGERKNDRA